MRTGFRFIAATITLEGHVRYYQEPDVGGRAAEQSAAILDSRKAAQRQNAAEIPASSASERLLRIFRRWEAFTRLIVHCGGSFTSRKHLEGLSPCKLCAAIDATTKVRRPGSQRMICAVHREHSKSLPRLQLGAANPSSGRGGGRRGRHRPPLIRQPHRNPRCPFQLPRRPRPALA